MALAPYLTEILVCPETRQPVRPAPRPVLAKLRERARGGHLKNRAGEKVRALDDALVREDGKVAYVVREETPDMRIDAQLSLESLARR